MRFIEKTDCKLSVNGSINVLTTYKIKNIFLLYFR